MARAVTFNQVGGPDVLRVHDVTLGRPGPTEVLIQIDAIGLNRGEAAFRAGHYIFEPKFPSLLGSEAAGRVLEIGTNVSGLSIGDKISTLPTFLIGTYGVYATQAIVPASSLLRIAEGIDADQAAATGVAFLTAFGGLIEAGDLAEGEFVILPAASSSVGMAAVQIAHDLGAIPIALTRTSEKIPAIKQAGAAHVIASEEQDIISEVARLTNGKGVRLIFDPVAGPLATRLAEALADEGTLIIYGGIANQPAQFPRHLAIRRNLTMRGYNFFGLISDQRRRDEAYDYIGERLLDGRFYMPVARTFELDQIVEAHHALEANQHVGKIVVVTGSSS